MLIWFREAAILQRFKYLTSTAFVMMLAACGGETFTPEAKRADAIKYFKLTKAQTDIMDAYYEGMTKNGDEAKFSRRTSRIAGCYASQIEMPTRFDVPHRDYIRDFEAVEKDYYPWFARRGISEKDAYDIGQRVRKTSDKCHLIIRR